MASLFSGKEGRRKPGHQQQSIARNIPTAQGYSFLDDTKLLKRFRTGTHQQGSYPPQAGTWKKEKLVSLLAEDHSLDEDLAPEALEEFEPDQPTATGRITIYCTAQAYDIKGLQQYLEGKGFRCQKYPEVLASRYMTRSGQAGGEIFYFEWGAVVFWDLTPHQEKSVLQETIKQFEEGPLSSSRVEADTFQLRYLPYSKPYIQNDVITMSPNLKDASLLKLSISFALSQSVKLSVLEERVLSMAALTKGLPSTLAHEGKVKIGDTDIAKLMGRVFMEQRELNLLGSVLDTPQFFWDMPDLHQVIYDRVWEYLEMGDRVEVMNTRLQVLHEMLDMLRLQQNAVHSDSMTNLIIWLIVVDVFIMGFQLLALLGWFQHGDLG